MTQAQAKAEATATAAEIGEPVAVTEDTLACPDSPDRFGYCPAAAVATLYRFARVVETCQPPTVNRA
jgi:hypothetical protein